MLPSARELSCVSPPLEAPVRRRWDILDLHNHIVLVLPSSVVVVVPLFSTCGRVPRTTGSFLRRRGSVRVVAFGSAVAVTPAAWPRPLRTVVGVCRTRPDAAVVGRLRGCRRGIEHCLIGATRETVYI